MKEIIPAIDLKDKKVVRLYQGDFNSSQIYSQDPLSIARRFMKQGTDWIHVVNLDGALTSNFLKTPNFKLILDLIELVKRWGGKIQIGGGIRTQEIFNFLSEKGVNRIIVGTIALKNKETLKKLIKINKDKLTVALDCYNGKLKIQGWTENSGDDLFTTFQQLQELGINKFIITDTNRDGSLEGPNFQIYQEINRYKNKETKIIASGGISNISDVKKVLSFSEGVIIGKALYTNRISKEDLERLIRSHRVTKLAKRIIPCLDVKDGRVVKGVNFSNLKDKGEPSEFAQYYNLEKADELVFLDISATLEERNMMYEVVKNVSEKINIPFTVGGGIKTVQDAIKLIKAGAEKVCINSAAVENPEIIKRCAERLGSQAVMVAIDAKKKGNSWEVYIRSGTKSTGLDAIKWAKEVVRRGAGEILATSIDRDGTKKGYDLALVRSISKSVKVPVIASGGAGRLEDFYDAITAGAEAVLAASLFHNNQIGIIDLKKYLYKRDLRVRL